MKTCLEIIEEIGSIELKPIGKDLYRGWCPIHFDNKAGGKPQFTYYASSDSFFCFRCGIGGDGVRLFAEVNHVSYSEAKKRLIGTNQEQLQENLDALDSLDVEISSSYNLQLNLTIRPKLRELLYKYPDKQDRILHFMEELDKKLKVKINFTEMGDIFKWFKDLQDSMVAKNPQV